VTLYFQQARVALPLNTSLWGDQAGAIEIGNDPVPYSLMLRRIAEFGWDEVRRAAVLNGATDIALTFADYISAENKNAQTFEQLTAETRAFIQEVERVTNAPVSLIAKDFAQDGVIDRRDWR
jgi:adenylosuccinate synthase